MRHRFIAAALLLATLPAFAAPNLALRRVVEAPDLGKLHDLALRKRLSPDERFFLADELRECAGWRGVALSRAHNPSVSHDPEKMAPGKSRDAVIAARKRCAWLTMSGPDLLVESVRLRAEALREKSVPALAESLPRVTKTDYRKAADLAIEVLESGDAEAIRLLTGYINVDEAFGRMKDDPYIEVRYFRQAWDLYQCSQGADCAAGSRAHRGMCIYQGICDERPLGQLLRASMSAMEWAKVEKYQALIEDIFKRREWGRFGFRASRYPWVENVNKMPAYRSGPGK